MGSKRPRDFTHSKRKSTRLKRKSATPNPSKFRTAADLHRDAKRIRGTKAAKQVRVNPTQVLREIRDGVPSTELHEIRQRLGLISSCVIVVQHALTEQSGMLDDDAALVLQRHVSDPLHIQLMKLDRLLGRDVDDDDIEEDEAEAKEPS